jgi:hypothetical protein
MTWPGLEPRTAVVGNQRLTPWAKTRSESAYIFWLHVF